MMRPDTTWMWMPNPAPRQAHFGPHWLYAGPDQRGEEREVGTCTSTCWVLVVAQVQVATDGRESEAGWVPDGDGENL